MFSDFMVDNNRLECALCGWTTHLGDFAPLSAYTDASAEHTGDAHND